MKTGKKSVRIIVHGLVQGVFFRDFTCQEAKKNNLCGWVRNRLDGTVECVLEGGQKDIDRMVVSIWVGKENLIIKDIKCLGSALDSFILAGEAYFCYSNRSEWTNMRCYLNIYGWLTGFHRGTPMAEVSRVDIQEEIADQDFSNFEVSYG